MDRRRRIRNREREYSRDHLLIRRTPRFQRGCIVCDAIAFYEFWIELFLLFRRSNSLSQSLSLSSGRNFEYWLGKKRQIHKVHDAQISSQISLYRSIYAGIHNVVGRAWIGYNAKYIWRRCWWWLIKTKINVDNLKHTNSS